MALKTLQIRLADLEGTAQGLLASRADVEVRVSYTREVILTDGTVIPRAQVMRGLSSTGVVEVQVYPSDDSAVRSEYRGFAVDVAVRGLPGASGWRYEKRVKVMSSMTGPVSLGTLSPAEPVPPQFTTVGEMLADIEAARSSAQSSQADAQQAAADAQTALRAQFATQDEGVSDLIGTNAGPKTRAALSSVTLSIAEGPYDVHRGGTIGSGDDTTAIQQAIVNAGDGAALRVRPGVTYIVSDVIMPRPGQALDLAGATLRWKDGAAHKSGMLFAISSSPTLKPWTVTGGLIDMNRANTPAPSSRETEGCGVHLYAAGDGWSGEYVLDGVTIINAPGNAIRVYGTPWSILSTRGMDAMHVAEAAVRLVRPTIRDSYRGVYTEAAGGCSIIQPDISAIDSDGILQRLTRSMQVIGGRVRSVGTGGILAGHGLVDTYGLGTMWQGTEVIGASYNGICAGGGDPDIAATRDFRWLGLRSSGAAANGFSIDPTFEGTGLNGHTVHMGAQLVGNIATDNAAHGLYLHSASWVNVSGLTASGNGYAGIAGDSYRCTIESALLQGNSYGIEFQGDAPVRADGASIGVSGRFTGFGQWRIGRGVRAAGNSAEDILIRDGAGYIGSTFDLEGDGSPEGVQRATIGSTYRDRTTGMLWTKTTFTPGTGSAGKSGWRQVALA